MQLMENSDKKAKEIHAYKLHLPYMWFITRWTETFHIIILVSQGPAVNITT